MNLKQDWVKINDESKRRSDNSNIRFKTFMIRSNLYDLVMLTYLLKELLQFETWQLQAWQ